MRSPPPQMHSSSSRRQRSRSPRRDEPDRSTRRRSVEPVESRHDRDGGDNRGSCRRREYDDRPRRDYDRPRDRDRDRDYARRRSKSPGQVQGGDGGWGKARMENDGKRSPGRPSLDLDRRGPLPSQQEAMGGPVADGKRRDDGGGPPPVKPIEPNFAPSGALAAETNTLRGVVLKYNEPPEARKPTKNWRLYAFKGKEQVDLFHVHRQSAYLIGRDRIVVDIPIDHPSTSKQHAVLQFRQVVERNEFGDTKSLTKPFIIDLDSANGTTVNDETVPASRFYELKTGDVLKFAFSTREYVLLVET